MLPGIGAILAGASSPKFFTYQELKTDTGGGSSITLTGATIGTAVAGRVVIVGLSWYIDNIRTLSSATIGGVSASILVQTGVDGGIAANAAIIAAVVPTGTTADIALTFSGSIAAVAAGVWTATGLDSAAAVDTGSNTDLSALGVTSSAGGFVIAVATNDSNRTTSWTGATENYDQAFDSVVYTSGASIASTGGTVTVTPTPSGSVTAGCLVAASF